MYKRILLNYEEAYTNSKMTVGHASFSSAHTVVLHSVKPPPNQC